jgi:hypothetical protein
MSERRAYRFIGYCRLIERYKKMLGVHQRKAHDAAALAIGAGVSC